MTDMTQPSTRVTRLDEKQNTSRERLYELLDSTPLATIALVRDGHPVVFPTGFARIADELVIHGSTGSPWMRALAAGVPAAVSVTELDGVVVARSSFESSFHYRSAVLFGSFEVISEEDKPGYLDALTDTFIPGRVAEVRASTRKELAATLAMRLPIGSDNWSLKISADWPDDAPEDVAGGAWAGVVPMTVNYGQPQTAPDVAAGTPLPESVRAMTGLAESLPCGCRQRRSTPSEP
ncbi:nitroimidazol reductase NimA-like FMN-containing flavoprotein (pyridoxamine 5'-phosphate oxidase superfamily) [Mycobacterium frederiksbergense]|uniref:Nitroimidazol reductase NimA-like FMN-containing flavoprotein (Pyridoxamine 5'-phosphate oxidase superfamily) n=1 Tax=Mycolicibacterium frederiksbergense TaxID=117567 RepID=A0ABT6L3C9_9MYCO|nr:pyridoxamine 5'-phosphate oxidase family protein [Mycolicibacterium frederiksbergense]MDH6197459.1 nitroimidazol reductase NimA-like FMN-containing flavoprotein (pyridoxamine 5'-phosphate oxidase superfamily) [Mycolicibacterium frederiksbergense]